MFLLLLAALLTVEPRHASALSDGEMLAKVRSRGVLVCGLRMGMKGFSDTDRTGHFGGLLVDYCRVIAAAVLGDANAMKIARLPDKPLDFQAVERGDVDIVLATTTWTLDRELNYDVEFLDPFFFDGQGFAEWNDGGGFGTALADMGPRTVCVKTQTTTLSNLKDYIRLKGRHWTIRAFSTLDEALQAFLDHQCELFTTDRSALTTSLTGYLKAGVGIRILPDIISREPLSPFIAKGDRIWYDVVRWAIFATIAAEEAGITGADARAHKFPPGTLTRRMLGGPTVPKTWGLADDWAMQVVAQVGNYGEIFERNLGADSPFGLERGLNRTWADGGLLHAPLFQ